jgi:hypothetical protein
VNVRAAARPTHAHPSTHVNSYATGGSDSRQDKPDTFKAYLTPSFHTALLIIFTKTLNVVEFIFRADIVVD